MASTPHTTATSPWATSGSTPSSPPSPRPVNIRKPSLFISKITSLLRTLLACVFAAKLLLSAAAAPSGLVHPGGWLTQSDLDRIRTKVNAGEEPWASAWTALDQTNIGLGTKADTKAEETNNYRIQGDGHKAYVLAIKWVATGDQRYADAAIKFINNWVTHVKVIGSEPMRSGLGGSQMAQAAEILAHGFKGSAGWSPADIKRAQIWFKTVVYPHPDKGASANWGTSAMTGLMSMAIFCDDRSMFDRAVDVYKHGFVKDGAIKDGCCGVTQYIDATGENAESGRDQPHSQGGIAHLVEVALCAANQHVNLVFYNDPFGVRDYGVTGKNRLYIGCEYAAKYNLGHEVPYHPFFEYCNNVTKYNTGPSAQGRGKFSPMWEMARALFTRAGLDAPYTRQVTESPGYAPEPGSGDHPGLGTLTFRLDSK